MTPRLRLAVRGLTISAVLALTGCTSSGSDDTTPTPPVTPVAHSVAIGPVQWSWRDARMSEIDSVSVGASEVVALGQARTGTAPTVVVAGFDRDHHQLWRRDSDSFRAQSSGGFRGIGNDGPVQGASAADAVAVTASTFVGGRLGETVVGLAPDTGAQVWSWRPPSSDVDFVGVVGDDLVLTTRSHDAGSCGADRTSVTVALDLATGKPAWQQPALCRSYVDGGRLVAGRRIIDAGTGTTLATAPGPVCGVAADLALWLPTACPDAFSTLLQTAQPGVVPIGGATGAPSFPAGVIAAAGSGPGVLWVVYGSDGSSRPVTRTWVAGSGGLVEDDGVLAGRYVDDGHGGVAVSTDATSSSLSVSAHSLDGRLLAARTVPAALVLAQQPVVTGVGPDYVLLGPTDGAHTGQVLLGLSGGA